MSPKALARSGGGLAVIAALGLGTPLLVGQTALDRPDVMDSPGPATRR